MRITRPRRRLALLPALLAWSLLVGCTLVPSTSAADPGGSGPLGNISLRLHSALGAHMRRSAAGTPGALRPADLLQRCPSGINGTCFTPAQIQSAYGVDRLIQQGIDGTGQTVVIIVSFGS